MTATAPSTATPSPTGHLDHPALWAVLVETWTQHRPTYGDWATAGRIAGWLDEADALASLTEGRSWSEHGLSILVGRWLRTCPLERSMRAGRVHYHWPDPSRPLPAPRAHRRAPAARPELIDISGWAPGLLRELRQQAARYDMPMSVVVERLVTATLETAR